MCLGAFEFDTKNRVPRHFFGKNEEDSIQISEHLPRLRWNHIEFFLVSSGELSQCLLVIFFLKKLISRRRYSLHGALHFLVFFLTFMCALLRKCHRIAHPSANNGRFVDLCGGHLSASVTLCTYSSFVIFPSLFGSRLFFMNAGTIPFAKMSFLCGSIVSRCARISAVQISRHFCCS